MKRQVYEVAMVEQRLYDHEFQLNFWLTAFAVGLLLFLHSVYAPIGITLATLLVGLVAWSYLDHLIRQWRFGEATVELRNLDAKQWEILIDTAGKDNLADLTAVIRVRRRYRAWYDDNESVSYEGLSRGEFHLLDFQVPEQGEGLLRMRIPTPSTLLPSTSDNGREATEWHLQLKQGLVGYPDLVVDIPLRVLRRKPVKISSR